MRLAADVRDALGPLFVGLYLYGSLATGDFDAATSDIDFLVVTAADVPDEKAPALAALHSRFARRKSKWASKLEGSYIPRDALRRYQASDPPRPTVNHGQFYLAPQGPDWVLQRHVLREHPVSIAGPSLRDLIDPVTTDQIRWAVRENLRTWWEPMLQHPARLENDDYQAYAVLTMCRSLYALCTGQLGTKRVAAKWAVETLPSEWQSLIKRAASWKPGERMAAGPEARKMIGFAVREATERP